MLFNVFFFPFIDEWIYDSAIFAVTLLSNVAINIEVKCTSQGKNHKELQRRALRHVIMPLSRALPAWLVE
jgi:hypothetical protein